MNIEEVKSYLRIDYDEDDLYIQNLILVSDIYIESCVGIEYKSNDKAIKLANLLQQKLIYDMYEKRGTEISNNTKKDTIVTTILDKLSNYGDIDG
ncbi:head-tail connector protein [Clostridium tertium]